MLVVPEGLVSHSAPPQAQPGLAQARMGRFVGGWNSRISEVPQVRYCKFQEKIKERDPQNGIPVIPKIIGPYKVVIRL